MQRQGFRCSIFKGCFLHVHFHFVICDKDRAKICVHTFIKPTLLNIATKNWSIWQNQTRSTLFAYNCGKIIIKKNYVMM